MIKILKQFAGTLAAVAVAAVVSAPVAAAADGSTCLTTGGATDCQAPGNVQIYTAPHALPTMGTVSNPKWQSLGHNPKWNGFQA
jgi:hypothetical protein